VVDLVNRLESEARAGRQGRLADYLTRLDFVVLDELGYLPFAQTGGQLLFHLIMLSWSVRFLIVGTGGGGYLDTNYGRAAAKVSNGLIPNARSLRDEFAQIAPNDSQFEAAFRAHSITNAEIARYVCRSIEAHMRNEPHPSIAFFENTNSSNLEHVLPRWPTVEWGVPHDVARAYFKRIGNLALLDPKVNGGIGNQTLDNKRPAYKKSPFLITQQLAQEAEWTPEKIEERQSRLAKFAPIIWPLTFA
jgi:hypothetical protein